MTTKAIKALFWKEYRQQITLLVALLVICVVVQAIGFSMSLVPDSQLWSPITPAYLTIAMLFTALYAAGAAAILFTVEHEDRTFQFLRMLPIGGGTVLVGKLAWLLASTIALGMLLMLESAIWCHVSPSSDSSASVVNVMGVAVVEALCWGLFWTTRCRSQLYSLLLTFISVAVASSLVANLMPRSSYGDVVAAYSSAANFRLLLSGVVGAIALWDAKKWLQKRVRESRGSRIDPGTLYHASLEALLTPPKRGEFRALLWQAFRQSRTLIIAMPVLSFLTIFLLMFLNGPVIDDVYFPIAFVAVVAIFVFPMIFSASVFFRDQQCRRAAMLTNIGVSPGKFWASRILLFGGVYLSMPIALACYVVFKSFPFDDNETLYDILIWNNEELTLYVLALLSTFCVGQLCSLLTRSLPIAFVLTIGGSLLCLMGIYLIGAYCVSWWLMLLPLIGLLLATRLRVADWMRGRDRWRVFARPIAVIVAPCVLIMMLVPVIRIYSVPNVSLGYAMSTDTRGMLSPDKSAERYTQLTERLNANLGDISLARQTWFEIQDMTRDANYPNYKANNVAIIYATSRGIDRNTDLDMYGQEDLRNAITFLGQMPETMAPASECVKRFFDARLYDLDHNIVRFRDTSLPHTSWSPIIDEVTFERTETIPLSQRLMAPWEYARTRRVWNHCFQTEACIADTHTNLLYHEGSRPIPVTWENREKYVLPDEAWKFDRKLYAPGLFQTALRGNENLPASSFPDFQKAEMERLLAIAKCAVKLWWLEHGELPENMAQLENESLDNSPMYEIKLVHTLEESGMSSGTILIESFERFSSCFAVGNANRFAPFMMLQARNREQFETSSTGPTTHLLCRELKFLKNKK